MSRQYSTEEDAVLAIKAALQPHFGVVREVQMRHLDGTRIRIDMIALPRLTDGVEHRFNLIGVEVKAGYEGLRDFNRALKQAIDYRHSRIVDSRSRRHRDAIPEYVFVYPDFQPTSDIYRAGYYGSVRLAGMFNVGVIREVTRWRSGLQLEFRVSDTAIWRSADGVVNSPVFGTARRRGAA